MAKVDLIVGAPAWDRAWSLPLWFKSLRANCDPADTGLVFVVPAADASTREAIGRLSLGFRWVEVLRDRGEQSEREERPGTRHRTLAAARNQILQVVGQVRPRRYVSWDTDFLVSPRTIRVLDDLDLPVVTPWTWLNRQPPKLIRHFDGKEYHEVFWQDPIRATAMAWDAQTPGRAVHYPAHQFSTRTKGVWKCGVTLAFQVMQPVAYNRARYRPHYDGEDVAFAWQLEQQGIDRHCAGFVQGVHLYDRTRTDETQAPWPNVMRLAEQRPLAAEWVGSRSDEYEAVGFYPAEEMRKRGNSN